MADMAVISVLSNNEQTLTLQKYLCYFKFDSSTAQKKEEEKKEKRRRCNNLRACLVQKLEHTSPNMKARVVN